MGSFAGHIDEATVFLLLGYWWMYKIFPLHIKAQWQGKDVETPISFDTEVCCMSRRSCRVPVEAILKTTFPLLGFLIEILFGGARFHDENGNFMKITNMQHMTIYGIFTIHGVIDLMSYYKMQLFKGADRLSVALALSWYAMSFKYHAHMPGKEGVEEMVHILPINIMLLISFAVVLEMWKPRAFLPIVTRIYGMLVLGTWFFHCSFILYQVTPFPGDKPNPDWDRTDARNVHFMVACFGFHLCLNLVTVMVFFFITSIVLKFKGYKNEVKQFKPLLQSEDEDHV